MDTTKHPESASPVPPENLQSLPKNVREALSHLTGGELSDAKKVAATIQDQSSPLDRRPIYIFDLDGTLSNPAHRLHLISGEDIDKVDWDAFHQASIDDEPILGVISMMMNLASIGAEIRIWTGRSEKVKTATALWLSSHTKVSADVMKQALYMRPEGNTDAGWAMKEKWLHALPLQDRMRIFGAFDDNSSVAEMFRRNGITCFQVANNKY